MAYSLVSCPGQGKDTAEICLGEERRRSCHNRKTGKTCIFDQVHGPWVIRGSCPGAAIGDSTSSACHVSVVLGADLRRKLKIRGHAAPATTNATFIYAGQ